MQSVLKSSASPLAQVVKMLGVGGSGETWLCIDNTTKKQLAVKFIKRPIPLVVLPMLRYEIKASQQPLPGSLTRSR